MAAANLVLQYPDWQSGKIRLLATTKDKRALAAFKEAVLAGKERLTRDAVRDATRQEIKQIKRESTDLKHLGKKRTLTYLAAMTTFLGLSMERSFTNLKNYSTPLFLTPRRRKVPKVNKQLDRQHKKRPKIQTHWRLIAEPSPLWKKLWCRLLTNKKVEPSLAKDADKGG